MHFQCISLQKQVPKSFQVRVLPRFHGSKADGDQLVGRPRLKLNCVDFEDTCREQGIRFYPTVRLYRRSSQEKSLEELGIHRFFLHFEPV